MSWPYGRAGTSVCRSSSPSVTSLTGRASAGFTNSPAGCTYPLARAMVVQTEAIAAWARARFRIPVHVIPNPVQLAPSGHLRKSAAMSSVSSPLGV